MKQSTLLNYVALITANAATIILAVAVVTGEQGVFGYNKWHLFACAALLYLASIAYGIGCIINHRIEGAAKR